MMGFTRPMCPQCQQPEAVQRTCLACGYVYPSTSLLTMLLRLAMVIPVGVVAMLTMFAAIWVLSKYLIIPAMMFITRL